MDRIAEKIAEILGSAWVIGGFGVWMVVHAFISRDYVSTISDLAIEVGLLILRAENVQAKRMERDIKKVKREVKT